MLLDTRLYIDGAWTNARDGGTQPVLNPATEEILGHAPEGGLADLEDALTAARRAFDRGPWPRFTMAERHAVMQRFHDELAARADGIKSVITAEAGSVQWLTESLQYETPMEHFRYALRLASALGPVPLVPEITPDFMDPSGPSTLGAGVVLHDPIGVVAAITPYNFPYFLNIAKLVPALLVGNAVVLKPSPFTPFEALLIGHAASAAGLPEGVLNIVTGGTDVGTMLTRDPRVDMVSFTGSDGVGAAIMAQAAPTLKRVLLELGGKSALIIRNDADLEAAAVDGLANFTLHAGQGCALQTRHIVHNSVRAAYVDILAEMARHVVVGDPADPSVTMGPLIRSSQRDRVERFVGLGIEQGARLVCGGRRPASLTRGYYYEPTIFDDVDNGSAIAQQEIFGPVVCVIGYDDDDQAVDLANASPFGLSGGIRSADTGKAYEMATRLRTGDVSINGGAGKMLSHAPFGGVKRSGLGREFGANWLLEYTQPKTVLYRAS